MLPGSVVILSLYTFSGITALAYEVLWMRLLSTLSGASNFGMVATLIAFMAGLGLGSALGARMGLSPRRALQLFGLIEIAVACLSLFLPDVAALLERGFEAMAASMGIHGWMTFHVIASVLLLLIPATALGMTFPQILRALSTSDLGVGRIYGLNTMGGALGALLPLALLPWLGWASALRLVAGIGILVGASALLLCMRRKESGQFGEQDDTASVRPKWAELMAYAGIGAAALMLEVGWTRLYSLVFMRTEYVLGVILAVVLLGIALGSLLARRVGSGLLNLLPLVASLAAMMPLALLPRVSAWMSGIRFHSLAASLFTQGATMLALTCLATLALGAWLPLIARQQQDEGGGAAWLYAFNSIGAALGAGIAGWLIIPWLGSTAVICLAAMLLGICGAFWCSVPRARVLPLLALPIVLLVWRAPAVSVLLPNEYAHTHDLFRYEDSVSTTDVVAREDGERLLLNDLQRVDASSDPTAIAVQRNQGRLPLLLHPDAHSVLFMGLGTGITASAAKGIAGLSPIAVELSPGAIRAARDWFAYFNGDVAQWLDIRHDDARRFLMGDTHHFDVIVGDLFHPDLVGRGLLLSLQQFQRVYSRLNESGVYVQWLALNQFDLPSLKVVLATFRQVFPHNTLMLDGFHLAMVGFRSEQAPAARIEAWAGRYPAELTGGEDWQTWLGRDLGPIPAFDAPVQDEWKPVVEFRLARARVEGRLDIAEILGWLIDRHPKPGDVLQRWQVKQDQAGKVIAAEMATDAMMHLWQSEFSGNTSNAENFLRLAFESNPYDRWVGFAVADAMADRLHHLKLAPEQAEKAWNRVLAIRPDHVEALRELWHLARQRGETERAASLFARLRGLIPLDPEIVAAQHQSS
jgi:spermidine synthase